MKDFFRVNLASPGHLSVSGYLVEQLDLIPLGNDNLIGMSKSVTCTSELGKKWTFQDSRFYFGQNNQLLKSKSNHRAAIFSFAKCIQCFKILLCFIKIIMLYYNICFTLLEKV